MKLRISTVHGKRFYRCGLPFGREPVEIDPEELKLSDADVKRLMDEPMLVVEEVKAPAPEPEPGPEPEEKKKSKRKR